MSDYEYKIGDKIYTKEELLAFGKQHYPKFYWIFRGTGLGMLFIGLIFMCLAISFSIAFKGDDSISWIYYFTAIPFLAAAACLLIVSFVRKPDDVYIKHAVDYYTKLESRRVQRESKVSQKQEKQDVSLLLKYKELLDAGIITQEEFEEKKKELL